MPTLAAALVSSVGSWLIDSLVSGIVGIEIRLLVGIIDSILIYFYVRRWLINLRDGL